MIALIGVAAKLLMFRGLNLVALDLMQHADQQEVLFEKVAAEIEGNRRAHPQGAAAGHRFDADADAGQVRQGDRDRQYGS
ncbi:MAG: hypothetical protein H0V78_08995 [Burkholderiales bacterium]|nr:hypothetical protein [Burkholderiales bacterium]